MSAPKRSFNPDWVVAPGETLHEWMQEKGVGPSEMAASLDKMAPEMLAAIIQGRQPINEPLARLFAYRTGISIAFWLSAEKLYREGLEAGQAGR